METQGLMDPQVADATVPPVLTSPEVVIAVREQPAMDDPIGFVERLFFNCFTRLDDNQGSISLFN